VSIEDDIALFERVPALRLIGPEALRILAIGAESRRLQEGEVLFSAGEAAAAAYLVQEGSFSLKPAHNGVAEEVAGPGTLLGELALIAETTWPATAVACTPTAVICIPRRLFVKILESYPQAARTLRDQLAARISRAMHELAGVRAKFDETRGDKAE